MSITRPPVQPEPYTSLQTVTAVAEVLRAASIGAQVIEDHGMLEEGVSRYAINLRVDPSSCYPDTTVYPPRNTDDTWAWGHSFELTATQSVPENVAAVIASTAHLWVRTV